MAIRQVRASGLEYLALATELLQRARRTDPDAGLWEAADLQWWRRTPRPSDAVDQLFWLDDRGPVAGLVLTDWGRAWGCDPILVPGVSEVSRPAVWGRALETVDALRLEAVEVLVRDDDADLQELLAEAGFVPGEGGRITWMDARDRPPVAPLPEDSPSSTAPGTRPGRTRCAGETARMLRPACGSARSTTRLSTSPWRPPAVLSPATRSTGSIR